MKQFFLFAFLTSLTFSCTNLQPEEQWVSIFNGENLDGWTIKMAGFPVGENFNETYQVADSVIKVDYTRYDSFRNEFGHLFYQEELQYFKLRLQYRFLGEPIPGTPGWAIRNSGIMLYSQSAESMNVEQEFPVSLEAQMLGAYKDDGRRRPTGSLCTPGTNVYMNGKPQMDHCIVGDGPTISGDEWVNFEVAVLPNGMFYHIVEGDTSSRYSQPYIGGDHLPYNYPVGNRAPVTKGYICLQAEGHPVEFRNIELLKLP